MEDTVRQGAAAALLFLNSLVDIKYQRISLILTLLMGIAGAAVFLPRRPDGAMGLVLALIPGLLMVLLSAASRGGVGMGDGLVLLAGAFCWTFEEAWSVFAASLALAGVYAAALFLVRRRGAERFAFVPFLFLADLLVLLLGG